MKNSEISITSRGEYTKMLGSSEKGRNSIAGSLPITHRQLVISTMTSCLFVCYGEQELVSVHDHLSLPEGCAGLTLQIQIHFTRWDTQQGFRLYLKQMLVLKYRDLKESI